MDDTIRHLEDAEAISGLPALAVVPRFSGAAKSAKANYGIRLARPANPDTAFRARSGFLRSAAIDKREKPSERCALHPVLVSRSPGPRRSLPAAWLPRVSQQSPLTWPSLSRVATHACCRSTPTCAAAPSTSVSHPQSRRLLSVLFGIRRQRLSAASEGLPNLFVLPAARSLHPGELLASHHLDPDRSVEARIRPCDPGLRSRAPRCRLAQRGAACRLHCHRRALCGHSPQGAAANPIAASPRPGQGHRHRRQ